MNKINLISTTAEQTEQIAHNIGKQLKGGECIELVADIGGGKTTFVRGLAKGAGSSNHVSSPTFTISKVYKTNNFDIIHFDFYRLKDAGLIEYELEENIVDNKSVIIIEWSDVIRHVLPKGRLIIKIEVTEFGRKLTLKSPKELSYLLKNIV